MNIPEEFGKYLLLKQLVEDPLGETFRAGKVGQEGMEQVVLLRVLNGKGIDGEKLWARISGRAGLQAILKSLEAAGAPARNGYLYFVSRNDGTHVFAETLAEHSRNVEIWQRRYWRDRHERERREAAARPGR